MAGCHRNRWPDASEWAVNRATFEAIFDTEGAREATQRDFLASRNMKVTGFPTLLAEEDGKPPKLLTAGYRKLDSLIPALEKWLEC